MTPYPYNISPLLMSVATMFPLPVAATMTPSASYIANAISLILTFSELFIFDSYNTLIV
jgi:hypothetical protein